MRIFIKIDYFTSYQIISLSQKNFARQNEQMIKQQHPCLDKLNAVILLSLSSHARCRLFSALVTLNEGQSNSNCYLSVESNGVYNLV